jgi:hypothetical protein
MERGRVCYMGGGVGKGDRNKKRDKGERHKSEQARREREQSLGRERRKTNRKKHREKMRHRRKTDGERENEKGLQTGIKRERNRLTKRGIEKRGIVK